MPTVLIADDDADHRELMTLALRRYGYDVLAAVLLDVRMPGESGIDFCGRLRANPATTSLPIMFVTADVNDSRIMDAMRAGADDYLTKPFHRAELAARLDSLLNRRAAMPRTTAGAATAAMLAARHALHRPVATLADRGLRIA